MPNNEKFNLLFDSMNNGVVLRCYVKNDDGEIINCLIDEVNPS